MKIIEAEVVRIPELSSKQKAILEAKFAAGMMLILIVMCSVFGSSVFFLIEALSNEEISMTIRAAFGVSSIFLFVLIPFIGAFAQIYAEKHEKIFYER